MAAFFFVISLLRCTVFRHFIVTLYLCGDNSDRQDGFDQSKISDYDRQYVEDFILSNL